MACIFSGAVIVLDSLAILVLLLKLVVFRSARGLSYDMFVCMVFSGVLFVAPNYEYIGMDDMGATLLVMVCNAAAVCVSFVYYLPKAPAEVPMGPQARPWFLRWYVLASVSVVLALMLCDHDEHDLAKRELLIPLYIDAAGRLPQLWLVAMEPRKKDWLACCFLALVIASRMVEAMGWIIMFQFTNMVVLLPIILQATLGIDFLYFWLRSVLFDASFEQGWRMSVDV